MKSRRLVRFIVVPIIFTVLATAVLCAVFAPTVAPYFSLLQYMTAQSEVQAANLFSGLGTEITVHKKEDGTIEVPRYPAKGDQYGQLCIDAAGVDAPLFYGDSTRELNQGAATYADNGGAGIPGQGRTVLVAAHNNTFFNRLQDVEEGDIVTISTYYGEYEYRITNMQVARADATDTYDFSRKDENLILYTCYPFDALGFTPDRYFVYAEYVSGPQISEEE